MNGHRIKIRAIIESITFNQSYGTTDGQSRQTIATIEDAYHKDILEKLGHIVQGGASI